MTDSDGPRKKAEAGRWAGAAGSRDKPRGRAGRGPGPAR